MTETTFTRRDALKLDRLRLRHDGARHSRSGCRPKQVSRLPASKLPKPFAAPFVHATS